MRGDPATRVLHVFPLMKQFRPALSSLSGKPHITMNTSTLGAILIAACVALVPVLFLVLLVKAPTALALLIFLLIVLAPVIFHLVVFAFFILAVLFMVRHW